MVKLNFSQSDGIVRLVEATCGASLMESAVAHDILGIEAACGGSCSCGTCHIYVDPEWLQVVGEPRRDEAMLLEAFEWVQPNSRLACQIVVTDQCDGLRITVAPREG